MYETAPEREKAIAVSVQKKGSDRETALEHLDELEFLAETAGADVIEKIYQEPDKPNPAMLLGKGKIAEVKETIEDEVVSLIIFDNDLTPAQARNLENSLKIKVMDRSGLILDIFAKRAKTLQAKTQVELAQNEYLLPRLTRMWTHLSKQYGGVGTKGPGETQIETDRRLLRTRIQTLKRKLEEIETQQEQQRKGRKNLPRFALVGYTNAGKSTLMNRLTESDVYVKDELFATLDSTVRAFELPGGQKAILSDTVGFIRKLPAHLVASFRSTLAEAEEADVILHVVDVSHPYFREQMQVVDETLEKLRIDDKPRIEILNKIDLIQDSEEFLAVKSEFRHAILLSASRGINVNSLLAEMQSIYDANSKDIALMIPYADTSELNKIYNSAEILERKDLEEGVFLKIRAQEENFDFIQNSFKNFIVKEEPKNG